MDYKNTLLLPKTDFPMRAELPKREPAFLAKWREEKIYDRIMAARKDAKEKFILHDGPPFANGDAHMGHALNMVLKDIVLKYQNMSGRYAPFVPGWDCHGLPIEHKVMKELGAAETDPIKIREKCEATALHFVGVQSEQFQRLGVFGDWDNPYLTLDPAYEAETLRVFATLVGKNLVYQGLRPVLWSTGCQTALAEAEIEYKEKVDPAIYVKFPLITGAHKFAELHNASLLIWTTTPWTLPANLAVAVAPNLNYSVYEIAGQKVLLGDDLLAKLPVVAAPMVTAPEVGAAVSATPTPNILRTTAAEAGVEIQEKIELVPEEVVKAIPRHLAFSLSVMPLSLEDRRLRVALADPFDFNAIDTLSKEIRYDIEPVVSPAREIEQALTRHYGNPSEGVSSLIGVGNEPKKIAGPWKGSDLVGLTYTHPFLSDNRTRQIFAADFVTHDTGTGLVHIAPGHGYDDYQLGQQHGLPTLSPVDDRGCLTAEAGVPELTGQYVFKANPLIIKILSDKKMLFAEEEYRHDYPHCWRSKTPIVFRAVKQWFIKMEDADPKKNIRAQALAAIDDATKLKFIPENGRNRIRGAVETRPDWCISRQRTWGIPLPVFYGEGGQPLLSEKVIRAFADLVEKEGAGIWFSRSADELAPALGLPLGLKKGHDTLDVWIDSGTSWAAVVNQRAELKPSPADLYLEGSDQHRGWFQSSLLTSVAAEGKAPYKAVLTNGFVVDIEGKKLSKSGEGYKKPVDLMTLVNEHGADVLRLWVASQDYQDDIPFSHDIFARVADTYRSIRNTLRILLGNLADFDPEKDSVPQEQWTELDQYACTRYQEFFCDCVLNYQDFRFSQVYHDINRFCTVDLSAFYIDVIKDRMYCEAKDSLKRRAAQTVITHVIKGLVRLLAPIVPFTAEESWKSLGRGSSVHTDVLSVHNTITKYPPNLGTGASTNDAWKSLLNLRSRVNEQLEAARRDKVIGKSLEALVEITTRHPRVLEGFITLPGLEELFIVSKVVIKPTDGEETITVTRAEDHGMKKCVRCWKYYAPETIGTHHEHPELCDRCTKVVVDLKF